MTVVHSVGYARPDPLEAAYRTIDRLDSALKRAWIRLHDTHGVGLPGACMHPSCIEIREVLNHR